MAEGVADTVLERISSARTDRSRMAGRINRFYELALPHRQLVGTKSDTPRDPGEQDDIFDSTLQDTVDDFASDMLDAFTPHYKPWVAIAPSETLGTGEQQQFKESVKRYEDVLYAEILASTFYQESQECWVELAGAAAGMLIPWTPNGRQIRPQPILMSNLLMDHGPNGELDGRWFEMKVAKCHLRTAFPMVKWDAHEAFSKKNCDDDYRAVDVIQGAYADHDGKGEAVYFCVYADGKKVHLKRLSGVGASPIVAMRWRTSPPSAWGPGPGQKGVSPGGALNELSYLVLKHLGKQADPPMLYDEDGLFNPEMGVNAGESYARRAGSKFDFLVTEQDLQTAFFEQNDLRMAVRRALYQDKPFQRADTPPTAAQWLDEKATNDKRLQLARMRIYDEWVIPVLQRFAWILQRRGVLPDVAIKGKIIGVRYVNPLSRASDMEDVTRASQFLQIVNGAFPQTAQASIDSFQTMANIKEKMGEELVVLKKPDQQAQLIQEILKGGKGNGPAAAQVGGSPPAA
ncbi:MAG: hypothetical protein GC155_06220 [Alphaproteobacteria bacterium]|nr:hypothetical protein [Alphaproteobacteria bacterium]